MVETTRHHIETTGQGDVHDLTPLVSRVLSGSSITSGLHRGPQSFADLPGVRPRPIERQRRDGNDG